jgi:hypothetical protein
MTYKDIHGVKTTRTINNQSQPRGQRRQRRQNKAKDDDGDVGLVLPGDTDTPPLRAYEDTDASSAATGTHPKAANAGGRSGVVCSTCKYTTKMRG